MSARSSLASGALLSLVGVATACGSKDPNAGRVKGDVARVKVLAAYMVDNVPRPGVVPDWITAIGEAPAPVKIVPETMVAVEVLRFMRREHERLAIAVDEHGVVSGMATFEDLIEELVGDVFSENDQQVTPMPTGAPEFEALIKADLVRWEKVIKSAGIKGE